MAGNGSIQRGNIRKDKAIQKARTMLSRTGATMQYGFALDHAVQKAKKKRLAAMPPSEILRRKLMNEAEKKMNDRIRDFKKASNP